MSTCRIRVTRGTPASGAFEWVSLGRQGEVLAAGAGDLAAPPVSGACELVLDSELVLLEKAAAPASQQRRLGAGLRYLAEELTLADPERLHVAAAPGPERDTLSLAIVDRAWLRSLLAKLEGASLAPVGAYPESLLPTLMPHAWTLVWKGGESFLRTAEHEAIALDLAPAGGAPEALRLALGRARQAGTAPSALVLRCARGVPPPDIAAWAEALGVAVELGPEWHWADAQRRPALELLQGEFAPRRGAGGWLPRLRRPALLAAALVLAASLVIGIDWAAKARERRALVEEMRSVYRDTFGEAAVIVDAPLQMSRALAALRRRAGQVAPGDFLDLLAEAARLLPPAARGNVASLAYEDAALTLGVRPAAGQAPQALAAELRAVAAGAGYEVSVREADGAVALQLRARRSP